MADNENTDPGSSQDEAGWIKELRKKAEKFDKLQTENATLKRDLAVKDVGLDTDDKFVKLFIDNYQGEWDAESLKEAASEYDLIKTDDEGDGEEEVSEEEQREQQAHQRVSNASKGAGDGGKGGEKPYLEAQTPEDFMAQYDGQVWAE